MCNSRGRLRIAVDTGGTFTDVVAADEGGQIWVAKALTTHEDVFVGVAASLAEIAIQLGFTLGELLGCCDLLTYATTHATNAILTGTTARTAFLTTEGFPDTLVLREGGKFGPFDHTQAYPDPYVPRRLTFEVRERVTSEGTIHTPLARTALSATCAELAAMEVEAVGVCLLWSVLEPRHELAVGEVLESHLPGVPFTLSHELNPVMREYRRASAACIDASLKPLMARHFAGVRERLHAAGLSGELLVVTSTGGVTTIEDIERRPILAVNSGPAIAPVAGAVTAASENLPGDAIVCDMGGTSFDASVLRGGEIGLTSETWLGGEFTGHLTGLSSVAVESIGYGGGSIAWIDDGGLLRVGPHSAGSDPGPACYGRGGTAPTLTDAALVLGYIDEAAFLDGRMPLDRAAAVGAVREAIGAPLGLEVEPAAAAVMALATASMASALEGLTIEQGIDPRTALLIGGGGACGLCVGAIGREIGSRRVLIPATASVLSAYGGLRSDLVADVATSYMTDTRTMDLAAVAGILGALDEEIGVFLARVSRGEGPIERRFSVDARYRFQVWDLQIPLAANGSAPVVDPADLETAFHAVHERVFGVREEGQLVECVTWRARGRATLVAANADWALADAGQLIPRAERLAYFPSLGYVPTPRFEGAAMQIDQTITGPATIELAATTIVVYPGMSARRTSRGHLMLEVHDGDGG
ncbi:MAG: hydantoinase/oxoprolinase family protein [Solirubrobacteraceae bacterium]